MLTNPIRSSLQRSTCAWYACRGSHDNRYNRSSKKTFAKLSVETFDFAKLKTILRQTPKNKFHDFHGFFPVRSAFFTVFSRFFTRDGVVSCFWRGFCGFRKFDNFSFNSFFFAFLVSFSWFFVGVSCFSVLMVLIFVFFALFRGRSMFFRGLFVFFSRSARVWHCPCSLVCQTRQACEQNSFMENQVISFHKLMTCSAWPASFRARPL